MEMEVIPEKNQSQVSTDKIALSTNRQIAWMFFFFLLLGSFTILFNRHWIWPVAAIALYFLIGARISRTHVNIEKFADSLYFMGFLFMLVSLFVALEQPFGGREEALKSTIIIKMMGTALITTIVGMSLRLVLIQFRPTVSDQEEDARANIAELIDRMQNEISGTLVAITKLRENIVNDLEELNKSLIDQVKKNVFGQVQLVGQELAGSTRSIIDTSESFKHEIQEIQKELRKFRDKTAKEIENIPSKLNSSVDKFFQGFSQTMLDNMKNNLDRVQQCLEEFSQKINSVEFSGGVLLEKLKPALDEVSGAMRGFSREVLDELKGLKGFSEMLSRLEGAVTLEVDKLENITMRLSNLNDLNQVLQSTTNEFEAFSAVIGNSLAKIRQFEAFVVSRQETYGKELADAHSKLVTHIEETKNGSEALRNVLGETVQFLSRVVKR